MSAISDDAVLAILKRHEGLQGLIATASTLQEAEKLAMKHFGGPGVFREKEKLARQFLEGVAAVPGAAIIGGENQ